MLCVQVADLDASEQDISFLPRISPEQPGEAWTSRAPCQQWDHHVLLSGQRSTGTAQGHLQKSSRHQWGQTLWPRDTHRVCCAGHTPLALLCHHKGHWDLLFSVSYWNRSLNLEGQLGSRKHMGQACHSDLDHLKMSPNLHVLPSFLSCQLPQHFRRFQHCKAGSWTSLPGAHRHEIKT